jgi:hypothetical protein
MASINLMKLNWELGRITYMRKCNAIYENAFEVKWDGNWEESHMGKWKLEAGKLNVGILIIVIITLHDAFYHEFSVIDCYCCCGNNKS